MDPELPQRAPPASDPGVEALLENAAWMRALARTLLRDEHRAEDAVQATWLATLRHRPARAASVGRWLSAVLRNVAIQFRRSDDRRLHRESGAAEPERLPSTLDVAARAEIHRNVVTAVLALSEPYRSTILLRFFDRLPPRVIAQRSNVPVATVHTRLQRGLAQLRARLEPRDAEGMRALAWPWEVLLVGTKTKLLAATAVVAIGAAGWLVLHSQQRDRAAAPRASDSLPSAAAAASPSASGADESLPAATRTVDAAPARPSLEEANRAVFFGPQRVRGRVVAEDHSPIAGATVSFAIPGAEEQVAGVSHEARELLDGAGFADVPLQPPTLTARTDALGSFEVTRVRAGLAYSIRVAADGYGERRIDFPFGDRGLITLGTSGTRFPSREVSILPEIVLAKCGELLVHVLDERGADAAGALVWCGAPSERDSWLYLQPSLARRTDREGRVALLVDGSAPRWLVAREDDSREGILATTEGAELDARGAIVVRLQTGTPLEVTVQSESGERLPGLRVNARYFDPSDDTRPLDRFLVTDDEGRCTFANLPAVSRELGVDAPGGCVSLVVRSDSEPVHCFAPDVRTATLEVALEGPLFVIRFVDADTRMPVRATRLLVVQDDFFEFADPGGGFCDRAMAGRGLGVVARDPTHAWVYLARPGPQADGSGPYPRDRQRESFGLVVDAPGFARTRFGPFDPAKLDRSIPLELALARGVFVTGSVRDADGHAVEGARLHVPGAGPGTATGSGGTTLGSTPVCSAESAADGSFRLGPFASGGYDVVASAMGFATRRVALVVGETPPGPLEIVLDLGIEVRGRVLLAPDEEPSRFAVVAGSTDGLSCSCSGLDEEGTFELGPLAPGELRLLAFALDFPDPALPARFDGQRGRVMAIELRKRLGLNQGTAAIGSIAPPGVAIAVTADVDDLELEPLRGERDGRLDLVAVLSEPMPDLERVEVFQEDAQSLERENAAVKDGRVRVRVGSKARSFIAVREHFRADPELWPDAPYANTQSWYVIGRVVTPAEIRRGEIELSAPRGSLEVELRRPGGAGFEPGSKFSLCFSSVFPGWRSLHLLPQICNNNGIILPVPADGRFHFDAIPAGRYQFCVFLPGEPSAKYESLEVRADEVTKFELSLDR